MSGTVIWATDGSPNADGALPFAKQLAGGGRLVALHANELLVGRGGGYPLLADEEDVEKKIRGQVAALQREGVDATYRVVTGARHDAAYMIAEVAQELDARAIVVGTRGHSTVAGLLIGSVTHRLLHLAPCPIVAVPPIGRTQRAREPEPEHALSL